MTQKSLRVLIVDDEPGLRELATHLERKYRYLVTEAATFVEAVSIVEASATAFDVAILDDMLMRTADTDPESLGIELMHAIRASSSRTEYILITGREETLDWDAIREGAFCLLKKASFDPDEVGHLIRQAAEFSRLKTSEREKQTLEQLMKTAAAMLGGADLDKVLEIILRAVHSIGFDRVRLYLLSEDRQQLIGQAQIGMPPGFVGSIRSADQDSHMQRLLQDPSPILVPREADQPVPFAHDDGLQQWASIPLILRGEVIGELSIDNISSGRSITETDLGPVAIFADQAAAAVETARLQQADQERARKLEAVHQVTKSLNASLDLEHTLAVICRAVVDLFDVDHCGFVLFDNDHVMGEVVAEYPSKVGTMGERVQLKGVLAEEKLIKTWAPIITENVADYEPLGALRDRLLSFNIQSTMVVPTVFQGKPLGSFSLDTIGRRRNFTAEETELSQILAAQAAAAIDNAQVHADLQQLFSDSPTAVIANDLQGKIISFNNRAETILGYSKEEIIGWPVAQIFHHPEEPHDIGNRLRASIDGRLTDYETFLRTKTQELIPVRSSIGWLYDGLGAQRGALGHFEDLRHLEVQKRLFAQSAIYQRTIDAIQSAEDLQEVFYLILSGITAGFGLGFNRAALFTCDAEKNVLVGRMGLGYLSADENQDVWKAMAEQGITDIEVLRERWARKNSSETPIGRSIEGLELSIDPHKTDLFSEVMDRGHWQRLESANDIQRLPHTFIERFEPQAPLIIVALRSGDEIIGLLVADNKFSQTSVTDDAIQALITFANTAAIAINKAQLLEKTQQLAERLERVSEEARNVALAARSSLLREIIERSVDLLDAHSGGAYEYDPQRELLTIIADHSDVHPSFIGQSLKLGEGMAGRLVLENRSYMIVDDYPGWEYRAETFDESRPFGSILEVLLRWRDEIVGVLYVEDDIGRKFTTDDARLLLMFADHAAIALKNSRLRTEDQLAWQTLKASFEASIALVVAKDPQGVLADAVRQAREVNNALNAGIIMLDNQAHATALYFDGDAWEANVQGIIRQEGISARVKQTGVPEIIENVEKHADVNKIMFKNPVKAAICLPFTLYGEHIGVMWVHYDRPRSFRPSEIDALQLYANQAAAAYDQSCKMETLRHMRQAAEAFSSAGSVELVLQQIVESAQRVLQADSAALWSYNDDRGQFVPQESVAASIDSWDTFRETDPRPGKTTYTVMERNWISVEDVWDRERYDFLGEATRESLAQIGVRSFQAICLHVGSERLGVLYVNYVRPRDFSSEERENIETLANHAALSLKNARLLQKVQKANSKARLVARLIVDQGLEPTLTAVVQGTMDVLGCDSVVLYAYDKEHDRFEYPPKMAGVRDQHGLQRLNYVDRNSIVFEMIGRTKAYVVPDAEIDPKFKARRFRQEEEIKSLVAIPLLVHNEPHGVIFVNYRQHNDFKGEQLNDIQLFADQAAVAIRDAQLFEIVRQRVGTLSALNEAGQAVTSSLDINAVLDKIAEQAWKLASLEDDEALLCSILLAEDGVGKIVSAYPAGKLQQAHDVLGSEIDWHTGINDKIGITGRAFQTGRNERVGDVRQDPDFLLTNEEARSAMAICIKSQETTIGFIYVEHASVDAFTERDERALEALAVQAAIAIQNAQFYLNQGKRLQESVALQKIAGSLAGTLELDDLLNQVMKSAIELTDTESGSILFWDAEEERFSQALSATGPDKQLEPYKTTARNDGMAARIARTRQIFVISDTHDIDSINPVALKKERRALIGLPLLCSDKVIGVLYVNCTRPLQFSSRQVDLLRSLADLAAVAIERTRKHEELKQTQGLLATRTTMAVVGMVSEKWSHTIATLVSAIKVDLNLMLKDIDSGADNDVLMDRLNKIHAIVNDITMELDIAYASSQQPVVTFPIIEWLEQQRLGLLGRDTFQDVNCRFEFVSGKNPHVHAHPALLEGVFEIFIDNAIRAMQASEIKDLLIRAQCTAEKVLISISDTGCGIPDDIVHDIRNRPRERTVRAKGEGIGLIVARDILQVFGGDFDINTDSQAVTVVSFSLPISGEVSHER